MKKLKEFFWMIVLAFLGLVLIASPFAAWRIDYLIWRAEHPAAPTWIFFVKGGK